VIVIGGVALQLQGSSYATYDLDLAYARSRENAARIATALKPFAPRPRDWSPDLPFVFDAQTLVSSEVLTLETTAGDLDLLAKRAAGRPKDQPGILELEAIREARRIARQGE
jgi:hypothetical protein